MIQIFGSVGGREAVNLGTHLGCCRLSNEQLDKKVQASLATCYGDVDGAQKMSA